MSQSLFHKFLTDLDDPDTTLASDGTSSAEFSGYIDTGSYAMNAVLSGSIYKGMPNNKALILAGETTTGKTFYALALVKAFLTQNPTGHVVYFDTESAVTNEMMIDRGIDITRVAKSEPESIEKFRTVCKRMLDRYLEIPEASRFPMLMILDSLSALPSNKETVDITDGKDTRDMTKSQLIKGAFRVLRLRLAKANVPLIITNHIYAVIGAYMPTKELAGGSGAKYAADTIVMLTKRKERDGEKTIVGNIITATATKSRLTKENSRAETRILYDGGLDKYYGLLDHAVEAGIVKKVGNKYEFPTGVKAFETAIQKTPEKFWTPDVLDALDVYIQKQFKYQSALDVSVEEIEEMTDDE